MLDWDSADVDELRRRIGLAVTALRGERVDVDAVVDVLTGGTALAVLRGGPA